MTVPKNDIHFETAYVVRVGRTQRILRVAGILVLVVVLPLGTFLFTEWQLGSQKRELVDRTNQQTELISALRGEVANLEQTTANSELSSDVDRNSLEQIRKDMVRSKEKIELLGEQIQFYQSLMDPNPEKGGVYLESVDIEAATIDGEYRYNIIVAQRSSNHKRVQGLVNLQLIAGEEGEVDQTFSLSELTENVDSLPLGFKFFQQLDGDLRLPQGFVPTRVRVTVRLNGSTAPSVDETFAWKS